TGCLVGAKHLTLEHSTDERQRHGHLLIVRRHLGKPLREAAADRPQLVEQERLRHTLDFNWERLADLDKVANARVGVGAQEDLPADRAPLDTGGEVDGGTDHCVLGALLGADVPNDGLARVNADAHLETWQPALRVRLVHVCHRALHSDGGGRGASWEASSSRATSGETYRPNVSRMKSRCRRPSIISLKARVSRPTSSRERTGSATLRSPAWMRAAVLVRAVIGPATRRATIT